MNRPSGTPEWVMDFAKAIRPESPDLLLSTNEKNILTAATQKILDLEAKLTQLRTERDRLRDALEIIVGDKPCVDALMSDKDVARAALTQREGGDDE